MPNLEFLFGPRFSIRASVDDQPVVMLAIGPAVHRGLGTPEAVARPVNIIGRGRLGPPRPSLQAQRH